MIELPNGDAIGQFHVSRGEFAEFVRETGHEIAPGCHLWNGTSWRLDDQADWRAPGYDQTDAHPVACVSWDDANAFAHWLGEKTGLDYRLPTEDEWLYAGRADAATRYFWGEERADMCRYANGADETFRKRFTADEAGGSDVCADGFVFTSPVGSFLPNGFGLYDMSGNLWQWTNSCFKGDRSNAVFRGGSWKDGPDQLRLEHSWHDRRLVRSFGLGFRVYRSAE